MEKNIVNDYLKIIGHSYMGVVWTHKVQEKQADIYSHTKMILKIIKILASSLTAAGLLSIVFSSDRMWLKVFTAILSFVSLAMDSLSKDIGYDSLIFSHQKAAVSLLELRDEYQLLILRGKSGTIDVETIEKEYQCLESKKHEIYKTAPRTTARAVKMAGVALHVQRDNEYSLEDINKFLPDHLKLEE